MTVVFVVETNTLKAEVAKLQEKLQINQPCSCGPQEPAYHTDPELRNNQTCQAGEKQLTDLWTYVMTIAANVTVLQQNIEALISAQRNISDQLHSHSIFPAEFYEKDSMKPIQLSNYYEAIKGHVRTVNNSIGILHARIDSLKTETSNNISQVSTEVQSTISQLEDQQGSTLTRLEELTQDVVTT